MAVLATFLALALAHLVRGAAGRRDHRRCRRSATRSGWACWRSPRARSRSPWPVPGPRLGHWRRRRGDIRRLPPERLPVRFLERRLREPHLVRWTLTMSRSAAVRLGVGALLGVSSRRPVRGRHRGLRPRYIGVTSPIPPLSLPNALAGLRGPAGRTIGDSLPTALVVGIGLGHLRADHGGSGEEFVATPGRVARFQRLLATLFPGWTWARWAASCSCPYVEFGPILAGPRGRLPWSQAGRRTKPSGRLELLLATRWQGFAGSWPGIGCWSGSWCSLWLAMVGSNRGCPGRRRGVDTGAGHDRVGLFAIAMAGVGIGVAAGAQRPGWTDRGGRDRRDLVHRDHRPGAEPAEFDPEPGPDHRLRVARWWASGRWPASSPRS